MSLPPNRDPDATYRVRNGAQHYEVQQFIPDTPVRTLHGYYVWGALPEWMKDCMAILDTAGPGVIVKGYGIRSHKSYWISTWEAMTPEDFPDTP